MGAQENLVKEQEMQSLQLKHKDVGEYNQTSISYKNFAITSIKTSFQDDYLVGFSDPAISSSVNMCISLDGGLETRFKQNNLTAELPKDIQHYNYVPTNEYELMLGKEMQCAHIAVNVDYYSNLLSESEKWSDRLKNNLKARKVCFSGPMKVDYSVRRILFEIFNTSYTNNLKEIFLEAKILELIAMQLHLSNNNGENDVTPCLKKKEKDLFYELRDYIDLSFTEEHSLKSLSRRFGINEFKLKQGFRMTFGTSVFNYIHSKKMSYAFSLIKEESKTINDVAGIIGYKNPNHFSTAFKKKFGVAPSTLR
jgi:AraC-like DNA-binding protein